MSSESKKAKEKTEKREDSKSEQSKANELIGRLGHLIHTVQDRDISDLLLPKEIEGKKYRILEDTKHFKKILNYVQKQLKKDSVVFNGLKPGQFIKLAKEESKEASNLGYSLVVQCSQGDQGEELGVVLLLHSKRMEVGTKKIEKVDALKRKKKQNGLGSLKFCTDALRLDRFPLKATVSLNLNKYKRRAKELGIRALRQDYARSSDFLPLDLVFGEYKKKKGQATAAILMSAALYDGFEHIKTILSAEVKNSDELNQLFKKAILPVLCLLHQLSYLQQKHHYVHRDIKPENMLIMEEKGAFYGLLTDWEYAEEEKYSTYQVAGTEGYLSRRISHLHTKGSSWKHYFEDDIYAAAKTAQRYVQAFLGNYTVRNNFSTESVFLCMRDISGILIKMQHSANQGKPVDAPHLPAAILEQLQEYLREKVGPEVLTCFDSIIKKGKLEFPIDKRKRLKKEIKEEKTGVRIQEITEEKDSPDKLDAPKISVMSQMPIGQSDTSRRCEAKISEQNRFFRLSSAYKRAKRTTAVGGLFVAVSLIAYLTDLCANDSGVSSMEVPKMSPLRLDEVMLGTISLAVILTIALTRYFYKKDVSVQAESNRQGYTAG